MRITVSFFVFAFCIGSLLQASPIPFSPIVRNYTVSDYSAGAQNWDVVQDRRGVMYIGNNKGLLEFDGHTWTLHELPTRGVVRSVYVGDNGKIYVGSYEEFGYFEPNACGDWAYHSLKEQVDGFAFHNDEIWSIRQVDGKIVFQSFNSLFYYDGHSVTGVRMDSQLILNMFLVNGVCYSQLMGGGLAVLKDGKATEVFPRSKFGGDDVLAGTPYGKDGMLLFLRSGAVFVLEGNTVGRWSAEAEAELKRHVVNRVTATKDGNYVVGTISNGIYAFDHDGRLLWQVNTDNGLQNNTVLGLYCDADNNIWAVLDDGIAYIQSNSPVYYYGPSYRNIGMVYDVLVNDDEAYIASNQGLYYARDGQVELIPGLEEQAWFVDEFGSQIFCGHNKGTFLLSGRNAVLSSRVGTMCMKQIDGEQGRRYLLGGTYALLDLYAETVPGRWHYVRQLQNFSHMVWNMETDHQGNIWIEHWQKGLYRFRINADMTAVDDVRQYNELGNVSDSHFTLFKINGRVAFSNGEAFYTYEDMNDSIVPYAPMNEQLSELTDIRSVTPVANGYYWFVSSHMAYLVYGEGNTFRVERRIPFALFGKALMEERATVAYDARHTCSYLCLNNAIACIDNDSSRLYVNPVPKNVWISAMTTTDADGLETRLEVCPDHELGFKQNSVTFSLAYPAYDNYTYRVRYRLEGLSEQWKENGRELTMQYARLPFGHYTFRAEVYDENGVLSAVELPFRILRPWYLTTWAILVYVIAGLSLLVGLLALVSYVVRRKKDRIIRQQQMEHQMANEQQEKRIITLENERLEADLRFKSKELSGVVMTNIAHQEFLKSLKEEIQRLRLSGQYTRKNLDNLLALVNNNLVSDEDNWAMFQANFDRIHENFFRNLKRQYPDLTSGDLRFCALLRLNMPTKEIAKFLNISIRGVDAARYRLRKKFNLASEDSLTDFMINFK